MEIQKSKLLAYVHAGGNVPTGGVVYQPIDGLVEVRNLGDTKEIEEAISASSLEIVNAQEAAKSYCPELADWSTQDDTLVYLSEGYVLCIPNKDVENHLI